MTKDYESILKQFQKELKINDKKVKKEINTKTRIEMSNDFTNFVKINNCKVKGKKVGGKNDK